MDCVYTGSEVVKRDCTRCALDRRQCKVREAEAAFPAAQFCLAALNLWIGVKAGHSLGEELPIFVLIFAIPAGTAAFLWWRFSG
jgi:hypothetical protein